MSRAAHHAAHVYDSKVAEWAVLIGSMAGVLMQALDTTIANVALPYMQGSLSASPRPDHLGADQLHHRRRHHDRAGGLAGGALRQEEFPHHLASPASPSPPCCAAPPQSLEQMVLFRLIQGVFGAALGPLSQAVMLDMYPPQKRGNVMAIWGMGVMLGPILGPTLGGVLTDAYNWRWVFYINVPFGIAACAMLAVFFKDTATRRQPEIRLVRLCRLVGGAGGAAADAGPRHHQGLVFLARDRDRGDGRRHRALSFPGPHADGEKAVHPA